MQIENIVSPVIYADHERHLLRLKGRFSEQEHGFTFNYMKSQLEKLQLLQAMVPSEKTLDQIKQLELELSKIDDVFDLGTIRWVHNYDHIVLFITDKTVICCHKEEMNQDLLTILDAPDFHGASSDHIFNKLKTLRERITK